MSGTSTVKWPFASCAELAPAAANSMEARMRAHDWAATPVGPSECWPGSLKSAVRILLDCQLPMYLAWGPEYTQFYNDGYVPILGDKDAGALGSDARTTWSEIWPIIGPMWADVLQGAAIGYDNFKLTIKRYGYPEDCYFNFSYSPAPDDQGRINGVLVTFAETTRLLLAERRLGFQLRLSDSLRLLSDPVTITAQASAQLGEFLGAGRAGYGEIDPISDAVTVRRDWTGGGMTSLSGETRPLDSFGPAIIDVLRRGRTLRLDDIAADPRSAPYADGYASIGVRSLLVVPLNRSGALAAILYLHSAQPRRWSDGDVEIAEDVAQRTWDAIERARAEEALRAADRRKDEFLAMLAHELRNPLAPISSAAQLLQLGRLDRDRVIAASQVIGRQVAHMTGLVDDLLDVSRVTRGQVELEMREVDVDRVLDTVIEQVRPLIDARGHRLEVLRHPAPLTVRGDFLRLVQVIANVLNNAAKYTVDPGRIELSVGRDGANLELVIEDDGIGIGPELLSNMFEPFVQGARSLGRSQGGLGLGLALVKSLVELHGGSVRAFSAGPGRGSRFTLLLPLLVPASATAAPAQAPRQDPPAAPRALRVLLVDDNLDAADILSMLLEQNGHSVTAAHDGRAALAQAGQQDFDVCILDIGLPDIDGYALVRQLRALPGTCRARHVALTGYGQDEDRSRALAAGFSEHMTKPADTAQLLRFLGRC